MIGALALLRILMWHFQLSRALRRTAPLVWSGETEAVDRYPSVTVVRPVRGSDVGAAENFAAALDTGYPGEVETLFVFDSDDDPGLPVAQMVVQSFVLRTGGRARVLIAGPPPTGRTGKLNAMVVGQRAARGELIAFGDSDTRPDRHVLRALVELLRSTPGAGAAFAPLVVADELRGAGDVFYALMQNALYAPLAAWAAGAARDRLPFIMGQLMVLTRPALEAIGGVACADGQLVDDMYIGRRVHEAGLATVHREYPLRVATGGLTLRAFMPIFRRWMMFSRNGLPWSFTWRQWAQGVEFFAALGASVLAVALGRWIPFALWSAAFVATGLSVLRLQREAGGVRVPLRFAWAAWGFFALAPLVALAALFDRRVEWRGRKYAINTAAELALDEADRVLSGSPPKRVIAG